MRDPEHRLGAPAAPLQVRHRALEALHPVDQHRAVSSQVPGQQDVWWLVAQLHHRDARAECLDRKHQTCAEHTGEVFDVTGHVRAGHVEEVEPPKGRCLLRTSVTHRGPTLRDHPGTLMPEVRQEGKMATDLESREEATASDAAAFVEGFADAWGKSDVELLLALLADDIVLRQPALPD